MSRISLLALALVATVVVVVGGTATARRDGGFEARTVAAVRDAPAPRVEASATDPPAAPPPVELLRTWDARRARAWARGDPRLLRALYTPGSVAGRRDRAMLRAWAERGVVVRGLCTQLLSVRELSHHRSARTLLVTDRLIGGVAVGAGVRRPLPQDRATTRTIRLRRWDGEWRVAWVLPGEVSA